MDGGIDIVTLISLIVAVVAILMLRNVLGRRTGDEETRIERYRNQSRQQEAAAASDKVVALPRRDQPEHAEPRQPQVDPSEAQERIKAFAGSNAAVESGLLQILNRDPNFEPEGFLTGARQAYEMIVTAFAEGNRRMLRDLLSKEVYQGFDGAIADRESRGEQIDQSFVGIDKSEILDAEVDSEGFASVTVRFVSQLITATRDAGGEIIDGDTQNIKDVTDVWTFSRDVSTARAIANPNWRLVATQAPA